MAHTVKHKLHKKMRTKALFCLATLVVGGAATSFGQNVYSANVVGYVNVDIPKDQYVLIANQLNNPDNKISAVLPTVPDGAQLQKFSGTWSAYVFDGLDNKWTPNGDATLAPGEGAFFKSPEATKLTFVGEVMQGQLKNTLPIGAFAVRSSMVPQAGTPTQLGIPGEDGDQLQLFKATGWDAYVYDGLDNKWTPSDPQIAVGASFFYKKASTSTQTDWVRNFQVQ
jgi:hypothetical protein